MAGGPIINPQGDFVQYGANPGGHLLQGMQVGANIAHQNRQDEMTNQYKNQQIAESQQKMDQSAREEDPTRMQNLLLGIAAITTDDPKVRTRAAELLHGGLSPEEQKKFGDYKNWTKADMTNVFAKSVTGKDFAPFLQFLSKDTANQTKLEIQKKKISAKASMKDPKVLSAWMNIRKDIPSEQRQEAEAMFLEKADEYIQSGEENSALLAAKFITNLSEENQASYEKLSSETGDYNKENSGIAAWWKGTKKKELPKQPKLRDTMKQMLGGMDTGDESAPSGIPEGFTEKITNKAGKTGYKNPKTGQVYVP